VLVRTIFLSNYVPLQLGLVFCSYDAFGVYSIRLRFVVVLSRWFCADLCGTLLTVFFKIRFRCNILRAVYSEKVLIN